jgi:antirestriction protein ArdC
MSNPIYQTVTDQIIAELEKGAAPWVKPWHADAASGADHNIVSGAAYRGVNRLILGMASMGNGYAASQWATYKQWQDRGAQVLKGQKGTAICFYKPVAGTVDAATGDKTSGYAVLKAYFRRQRAMRGGHSENRRHYPPRRRRGILHAEHGRRAIAT